MISNTKFLIAWSGTSTIARKVYDAVPISEHWTINKIASELRRLGVSVDFRIVGGCLNTLMDSGLVREPESGMFQREEVKPVKEKKEEEPQMATKLTVPVAKPKSPMDQLEELSKRATSLAEMVKQLADDIGETAINLGLQAEAEGSELAQLRQLKTILQGLK